MPVSWSFVKSRFLCNGCKEWMACGAFLVRAHISRVVIVSFRYSHYSGILTSHSQFWLGLLTSKWHKYLSHGSNYVSNGHFSLRSETGSVLCRIALWDCFSNTVTSFIGYKGLSRWQRKRCLKSVFVALTVIHISYTSDNQRLPSAGEIDQRSKRSCSNAVLCVSFMWQKVQMRVIRLRSVRFICCQWKSKRMQLNECRLDWRCACVISSPAIKLQFTGCN